MANSNIWRYVSTNNNRSSLIIHSSHLWFALKFAGKVHVKSQSMLTFRESKQSSEASVYFLSLALKKSWRCKQIPLNVTLVKQPLSIRYRAGHMELLLLLLFSRQVVSVLWPHEVQHGRLPCLSLSSWVCSNYVHGVGDAIPSSHSLSPPSPLPLNLS